MRSVLDDPMGAEKSTELAILNGLLIKPWQYFIQVAAVAIASVVSAQGTLAAMGIGAEASPIWPPAGIALGAILLGGNRLWVGVFFGDWLLMQSLNAPVPIALGSALGTTLAALAGAHWLRKFDFRPSLERLRDVLALVLIGALVSPLVNISIDALTQGLLGTLDWQNIWHQGWILWLGDATAIVILIPLFLRLCLANQALLQPHAPRRLLEAGACFLCLLLVCWGVFACKSLGAISVYPLEYLPFPFVVWAALRFRTWGAVLGSSLVSSTAMIGVLRGVGPFVLHANLPSQAIFLLDTFLMVVTITALMLSAVMSERQLAEEERQTAMERDRLLAEVALRIRQSLELEHTFTTTVAEIRTLLGADRVYIGYLDEADQPKIVAESVAPDQASVVQWQLNSGSIQATQAFFKHHDLLVINDTAASPPSLPPFPGVLKPYYQQFQVKAVLAIPLKIQGKLSGLLVAHQCHSPRHWQTGEIEFFRQLGTQVAIAIQQAQLYRQVQQLNCTLEQQVKERTQQLQEKMQEVQELYAMKNVFLQAVSHDIRTSIMGLLMILKNLRPHDDSKITLPKAVLDRIIDSSDRQLTLINALSEDHFQEPTKIHLNPKPLSLKALVNDLLNDWQRQYEQNQGTLLKNIAEDLPMVMADAKCLTRVFGNILGNALKHNPPGITLRIDAQRDGDMLCCYITDDGLGMCEQQCEQLFKLYMRSSHNHRLTGVGLGSYQCRQIIEAHGGQIGVKSTPGQGTQVWFKLPCIATPMATTSCR